MQTDSEHTQEIWCTFICVLQFSPMTAQRTKQGFTQYHLAHTSPLAHNPLSPKVTAWTNSLSTRFRRLFSDHVIAFGWIRSAQKGTDSVCAVSYTHLTLPTIYSV